jgi:hypothetical protein
VTGRALAEGGRVEHRYAGGVVEPLGKFGHREPGAAHVDEHEHAGLGPQRHEPGHRGESRVHGFEPAAVGIAHAITLGGAILECVLRRLLDESRQAVEHAQGELVHVFDQFRRADRPADAPAGHCIGFRQAADRDQAAVEAGLRCRGCEGAIENEFFF